MNIRKVWNIAVAAIVGGVGLFVSDKFWTTSKPSHFTTQAEAIIGRPLTPFSVAGVARRTTRRAVAAGYYGYGYRSYGYGDGGYGYPSNYGYANYGTSYPSSYGYANYGTSYPSSFGYANYGTGYSSNYGYANPIPTLDPSLWCFPPSCDRSRYTDASKPYNPQRRQVQRNKQGDIE